jgi:hypothetical protein
MAHAGRTKTVAVCGNDRKVSGEGSVISNVRRGGYATNSGYQSYETGIVLGMDQTGKLWIIEVNLAYPSFELFKRLPDTEA